VRVKEEADFRLAIAKLFLEFCASGGGVGHGSSFGKVRIYLPGKFS
jgi:hypothetical protein